LYSDYKQKKEKKMEEIFIENKAISPVECPVFSNKK